jgi:cytochrome d ubiquinol oxidase subunit II
MVLVLVGWFAVHYPSILVKDGVALTFSSVAAGEATLRQLTIALVVGALLIFPSLFFLFRIFKRETF